MNNPLKKRMDLLRLGQDIYSLHLLRYGSQTGNPYGRIEDAKVLREKIAKGLGAARSCFLAPDVPDNLKTAMAENEGVSTEKTYILALIAYASFSSLHFDRSIDGVCKACGVINPDHLIGALMTRQALLELIAHGVLRLPEVSSVRLSDLIIQWVTEGNPFLALSPKEIDLQKLRKLCSKGQTNEPNDLTFPDYQKQLSRMTFAKGKCQKGGKILFHAIVYQ